MARIKIKPPPELEGFPKRLAVAIGEATQKQLEAASGVPQSTISRLVTGRDFGGLVAHVMLLANALQVRIGWLLADEEPMRAPGQTRPIFVDAEAATKHDAHALVRPKDHIKKRPARG